MRLIDADAATNAAMRGADRWDGGCSANRDLFIMEEMKAVPTVDAVPVVRCQDCAHSVLDEAGYRFCDYTLGGADVDDLFYCADGEHREEEYDEG